MTAPFVARCSKGWGGRCPQAKSAKCRCQCHGENHGNPAARTVSSDEPMDRYRETVKLIERDREQFSSNPVSILRTQSDITAIRCERVVTGPGAFGHGECVEPRIYVVRGDSQERMHQRLVYHSPDGMEFGYGGSGPADLALNILALIVRPSEAWRLHQDFKREVMGRAFSRDGGVLNLDDARSWVTLQWMKEPWSEAS